MDFSFATVPASCTAYAEPDSWEWMRVPHSEAQKIASGQFELKLLVYEAVRTFMASGEEVFGAVLYYDIDRGCRNILVKQTVATHVVVTVFLNFINPVRVQVTCVLDNGDLVFRGRFDRMQSLTFAELQSHVRRELISFSWGNNATRITFRRSGNHGTARNSDRVWVPRTPPRLSSANQKRSWRALK